MNAVSGLGFARYERHGDCPKIEPVKSPFILAFIVRLTRSNRTDQPHHAFPSSTSMTQQPRKCGPAC